MDVGANPHAPGRPHIRRMRQALALLVAIFNPLGALTRLIGIVLGYLQHLDRVLADPELEAELRGTPHGRRAFEGGIAFAEHWIGVIIAGRASEIAGRRIRLRDRWTAWQPAKARSWDGLMQRYRRCRDQLHAIERLARRRAARMMRALAANPLGLAAHDDDPAVVYIAGASSSCAPAACSRVAMRIRAPP